MDKQTQKLRTLVQQHLNQTKTDIEKSTENLAKILIKKSGFIINTNAEFLRTKLHLSSKKTV